MIKQLVRQGKISEEIAEEIQAEVDGSGFEIVAREDRRFKGRSEQAETNLEQRIEG